MISSKPQYKFFPQKNKTVTPNKVIDTSSNPSLFILFSITDKVKFTSSERVLLTNCVDATMVALSIVQNAAAEGFAGHLEKLELYFGSSSPETINCVTEMINTIYKLLTGEFSYLTFFNITKTKDSFIYNKQWIDQFSGALTKPTEKTKYWSSDGKIIVIDRGIDVPKLDRSKAPRPSSEKMAFVHDEATKKWIEHKQGVNVHIDLCLLPPVAPLENTVKLIFSEVMSTIFDLDVPGRKIKIKKKKSSTDIEFSTNNLLATGTLRALSNEGNWGSFIAFFTEPLPKYYLQHLMRKVEQSHISPRRTIKTPI